MRYNKTGISLLEYRALLHYSSAAQENVLRVALPQNDAELAVLSEYVFGIPVHLKLLSTYSYEVLESHNTYYDSKFSMTAHQSSYEVDHVFWATVIGKLTCGGIAHVSYGQFDYKGHRHKKRILRWIDSRHNKRGNKATVLRPAFVRLAAQCRERREQRDSR